jgi:cytochrome c553
MSREMLCKKTAFIFGAGLAALLNSHHTANAQDAANGKQLYLTRTCVACHGKDGAKAIQSYPHLAGLDKTYLYSQMKDIAEGKRVSGPDARGYPRTQAMKDVMNVVTDEELKIIAAWLAAAPPPPVKPGDASKVAEGAQLYVKSGCVACHGKDGAKPLGGYPAIAGQKKEYIALQIKEIRDGVRLNGRSKMMAASIKKVSDTDADTLAEFLSQTSRTEAK